MIRGASQGQQRSKAARGCQGAAHSLVLLRRASSQVACTASGCTGYALRSCTRPTSPSGTHGCRRSVPVLEAEGHTQVDSTRAAAPPPAPLAYCVQPTTHLDQVDAALQAGTRKKDQTKYHAT